MSGLINKCCNVITQISETQSLLLQKTKSWKSQNPKCANHLIPERRPCKPCYYMLFAAL